MTFKNKLKNERKKRNLKKFEMADLLGVNRATYNKWEQGDSPSTANREKVLLWFREHPVISALNRWTSERIKALYKMSNVSCQDSFAKMVGPNVKQPSVSSWLRGNSSPTPMQQQALDALAAKIGFVLPPNDENNDEAIDGTVPQKTFTPQPEPENTQESPEDVAREIDKAYQEAQTAFLDATYNFANALGNLIAKLACTQVIEQRDEALAAIKKVGDELKLF